MSEELLPCPFCGGEAALQPVIGAVICAGCHVEVYAPRPLPRTEAWNKRTSPNVSELREELETLREELEDTREKVWSVVEELGLASEFASEDGPEKICDALRELNALALETLSAREDALRNEGRADYFASLLTRLLATRQGRTVGYEPPEVQALWRKVEKALEGKEGAK